MRVKMQTLINKFKKSESGSFLPIFGVVLFPLLTMVMGASVDYARMNNLQSRMQSSSDIALLAATKAIQANKGNKTNAELNTLLKDEFKPFFQANMKLSGYGNFSYAPKFNSDSNQSTVTVTAEYEPIFMQLFGYNSIDVAVDLAVNLKVEENYYVIDIVMCLDATGSMQQTLDSAVNNAKSFNKDLREELGMVDDPLMKVRVRPMFYRDWEDAKYMNGLSPLDGGTSHTAHHNSNWDVFKYTDDFIDLDPNKASDKSKNTNIFRSFLNSENANGGFNWPEAGATCINQGAKSNWYQADSDEAREYFNFSKETPINQTSKPNNVNVTVVPVLVFWTDATISDPALTRQYIDSTQPGNWNDMKNTVWNRASVINQKNKILVLFGPDPRPETSGFDKAYEYFKTYYPDASEAELLQYAEDFKDHNYFNSAVQGWDIVRKWDGFAYGGSLGAGNKDGAKIIGKKIKEKLPDLMRLAS